MGGIAADYTLAKISESSLPRLRGRAGWGLRLGCQVVEVRAPRLGGGLRREAPAKLGAHPVEAPSELVAVSLRDVFHRQIGQPAPGQTSQQVPGGPFHEVPRIRPERTALVAVVLVGVAGQQRQPVGRLQTAGLHRRDNRVGRVGDRVTGQHHLARPDSVGANRQVLVEMDAAPDRAADGGVLDEKWQRLVADRVADAGTPPVRLTAVAVEPESAHTISSGVRPWPIIRCKTVPKARPALRVGMTIEMEEGTSATSKCNEG